MDSELTELDFSLIHALQLRPRATWAELAPILHTTPVRLARRWETLTARGDAWVTGYVTPVSATGPFVAMTELLCRFGALDSLSDRLLHDARVLSIEQVARGQHLLLTIQTATLEELSELLLDELPALEGVESIRTHVVAEMHYEASRWRLGALDSRQMDAIIALGSPGAAAPSASREAVPSEMTGLLIRELARDGRASAADIASRIDRPVSTVRRHLGALLRSKAVILRCEVAQSATRWPITVTWWCRAPVKDHRSLVQALSARPELRLCMSLTGPANVLISMWVASLPHLLRIQGWMESNVQGLEILENTINLRTRKRLGWELDRWGRAIRHV